MEINPDSHVGLHVANTQDIVEKVLNYDLDIGLIEGDINHHDLKVYPWMTDELAIFCRPEHPLAAKQQDRKSTRLNSSHVRISYAVFCLKKKNNQYTEYVIQ